MIDLAAHAERQRRLSAHVERHRWPFQPRLGSNAGGRPGATAANGLAVIRMINPVDEPNFVHGYDLRILDADLGTVEIANIEETEVFQCTFGVPSVFYLPFVWEGDLQTLGRRHIIAWRTFHLFDGTPLKVLDQGVKWAPLADEIVNPPAVCEILQE